MTPSLALAVAGGGLIAAGVYLLLERSLMRILAGIMLASNGVSMLFLVVSGPAGLAPIVGEPKSRISDPLPQALVLTAIVITLATSAFLLAMSYRLFQLEGHDEVSDDVEDALVRRRAHRNQTSESFAGHEADEVPTDTEVGGIEAEVPEIDQVAPGEDAASAEPAAPTNRGQA